MFDILTLLQCLLPANLSDDYAAVDPDHHGHVSHERTSNDALEYHVERLVVVVIGR
jgi:hypothetical protein